MLFIRGGNDDTSLVSEIEECLKAADKTKRKIIIEGASHGLRPHREKIYRIVVVGLRDS